MQKLPPIPVPKGIRYISDWKEIVNYLPTDEPYIMNKTITGCGFTEYWITNDQDAIICSPRKVLLENKDKQHQEMENLLYLKDEYATFQPYDRDLTKVDKSQIKKDERDEKEKIEKAKAYAEEMKLKIIQHRTKCALKHLPCKYLVTYDSFRRIKEALGENISRFSVIVDEFQSIFTDSRFKSDTENSFLNNLQCLKKVCYLSATPMIDKYLNELDEFKNLKYLELDWKTEDPKRVITPFLKLKQCSRGIIEEVKRIIQEYKNKTFEKIVRQLEDGTFEEVYSKEAVIYVNSVRNICDIIKKCKLTLEDTNVLCASDSDNKKKIRAAFNKVSQIDPEVDVIGTVPGKGEPHKMFTLCTRTVYLGADFYSTNARSFIFSDANVDCLSVDITLDLPQILGRQRLDENPWKNRAELYYKTNTKEITQEEFRKTIEAKIKSTEDLLQGYREITSPASKHEFAEQSRREAKNSNYKYNYLAVNERGGSDLIPIFNKLMMISELRAFEIQQYDYKDRVTVFNAIAKEGVEIIDINNLLETFYHIPKVSDKYRFLCSLEESTVKLCLPQLPESFINYYTVLGPEKLKALRYNVTDLKREYERIMGNQEIDISKAVQSEFKIGDRVTKSVIKDKLKKVYDSVGYSKTPKAVDLGDYFIIKSVDIKNDSTGKRDKGYEILAIKT
jgi:hypothetical protein